MNGTVKERRAVGVSFDETGYGGDGTIWGGELFIGSVSAGWTQALHLRKASLPGGHAAARFPVQCAAGFLSQIEGAPPLLDPPFCSPPAIWRHCNWCGSNFELSKLRPWNVCSTLWPRYEGLRARSLLKDRPPSGLNRSPGQHRPRRRIRFPSRKAL